MTVAKGLDSDEDGQNVSPDLDPNCLIVFLKEFLNKIILKKVSRRQQKHKITQHAKS